MIGKFDNQRVRSLIPHKERTTDAQGYLAEIEKDRKHGNIESVRFIPPVIGGQGFGHFKIRYKTPVLFEDWT
mgnify:CR=1 FL=1